ncbi:hypothetical protein H0H87_007085 [Tephrocybe sp. NHM501043]|nr:hypothetical protein H0H87_007085 [Tephrocybe sp. NHM501043]
MLNSPVDSATDLNSRVEPLQVKFSQPETEDSWEIIANNLKLFTDLCLNAGACEFTTELIVILRSSSRPIINSLVTERTRLSLVAIDLLSAVATGLGKSFKPLLQIFLPTLLSLCGRTNKVIITRSRACITTIIEMTQLPSIISYFLQAIEDKSSSIRFTAAEGTLTCVNCFNPPDLEKDARASEIEKVIRMAAKDAQADIRVVGRKLFEAYRLVLPNRVDGFTGPLSPTTKKYLDIKTSSNARQEASHTTSKNKFSSSTSATTSTRNRLEANNPTAHALSASSSTLSADRRTKSTSIKASAPATRQKTEMPPPAFVPIRPPTRTVSDSRSTTTVESRSRAVSTTLPSRKELSTTMSAHAQKLPARPNSAASHRDAPQRLRPQQSVPTLSGPSGPRRVPITDASSKAAETNAEAPVPAVRSRVPPATGRACQPDVKVLPTRAPPAAPVREKPKPVPRVGDNLARPSAPSRPATSVSTTTTKPPKVGSVTQPTLSQLSRAKASTVDRKQPTVAPSKQLWGRLAPSKTASSSSSASAVDKGKFKPTRTEVKKNVQPATIPLPPSPTPSTKSSALAVEEPPALSLTSRDEADGMSPSDTEYDEALSASSDAKQEETMTASSHAEQEEIVTGSSDTENADTETPLVVIHSPHAEEEPGIVETTESAEETLASHQIFEVVAESAEPSEVTNDPTTPTVISTDTIFDTNAKTPISSLLSSIQRGFLLTPSSPLSPPQSYLDRGANVNVQALPIPFPLAMNGSGNEQEKGMPVSKPFMFGVGEEYRRSMLSSVENLDVHK